MKLFTKKPPLPTCGNCGQHIMAGFDYPIVIHIGQSTIQDTCCSKACVQDYKLRMLREEGL